MCGDSPGRGAEFGSAEDTTYDLSLLRWSLKTLIHIADSLLSHVPIAPALLEKWRHTLEKVPPCSLPTRLPQVMIYVWPSEGQ